HSRTSGSAGERFLGSGSRRPQWWACELPTFGIRASRVRRTGSSDGYAVPSDRLDDEHLVFYTQFPHDAAAEAGRPRRPTNHGSGAGLAAEGRVAAAAATADQHRHANHGDRLSQAADRHRWQRNATGPEVAGAGHAGLGTAGRESARLDTLATTTGG